MEENVIKRVDLLMPAPSRYGVLHAFTQSVYQALKRTDVHCELHVTNRENPRPFLEKVFASSPDFTLSFHGLLPDDEGNFLCDLIGVPHVCLLVDHPFLFTPLVRSPLSIIACPDHTGCSYLQEIGFQNTFFLPQAVDRNVQANWEGDRPIELLFLGSGFDVTCIEKKWGRLYPKALVTLLKEAARVALDTPNVSFPEIFANKLGQWSEFDPSKTDILTLMIELENYMRGLDRSEMLSGIDGLTLHIFGKMEGHSQENMLIGRNSHTHFHAPIPFEEGIEKMQQSRFVFNSSPSFRYGAHERIFTALAAGACVITQETHSLRCLFGDEEGVIFYKKGELDQLNERLQSLQDNESQRQKMVERGREKVMRNHTWDTRVARILSQVPPLLSGMQPGNV